MKSISILDIRKGNTDNTAKVARDRSVPSKGAKGPKDALHVFPLKFSLYASLCRSRLICLGYPASILAAEPTERAMGGGGGGISLAGFAGLPWRLYRQDTRPIPQTLDNCLIDVKDAITIKLEIHSLCALSSVPASLVPPEDWAGRRRKRAENWILFRFLLQLNLSTMGTKGSGRWVNVWTVRQEVAIVERWPMWRGGR